MIFAFADLKTRGPQHLGLNRSIREVEPAVIRRDVVRVRPLVPAAAAAPVAVPPPTPAPAARFEEPEEYERWDGMA